MGQTMGSEITSWYSEITELNEIAKRKGYTVEQGSFVCSVNQSELLSSPAVKKALRVEMPGVQCLRFSELWDYQLDEVNKFLKQNNMDIKEDYLDDLDEELSQIVYDDKDRMRAMILCRSNKEEVFVDLLIGATKTSEFIMTALQGFVRSAEKSGLDDRKVVMLAASDTVMAILKRVMHKKYEISEIGTALHTDDDIDEEFVEELEKAEKDFLCQKNIRWKYPWSLNKNS